MQRYLNTKEPVGTMESLPYYPNNLQPFQNTIVTEVHCISKNVILEDEPQKSKSNVATHMFLKFFLFFTFFSNMQYVLSRLYKLFNLVLKQASKFYFHTPKVLKDVDQEYICFIQNRNLIKPQAFLNCGRNYKYSKSTPSQDKTFCFLPLKSILSQHYLVILTIIRFTQKFRQLLLHAIFFSF